MAALTADRSTDLRPGKQYNRPVAAATEIFAGSLVVLDASGNAEPGTTAASKIAVGRAEEHVDNTGAAAAKSIEILSGEFKWVNSSGDPVTKADEGSTVYIEDDQTVSKTSVGQSAAGTMTKLDADGGVWVHTSLEVAVGSTGLLAANNLSDVAVAATSATNLGLGTGDDVVHDTIVAKAKTQTVAANAYTVVNGTDAGIVIHADADTDTVTLPDAAAANLGQEVTIICGAADGAALISVSPHASDYIFGTIAAFSFAGVLDKDADLTLATQNKGDYIKLVSDGSTGWYVTGGVGVWASEA